MILRIGAMILAVSLASAAVSQTPGQPAGTALVPPPPMQPCKGGFQPPVPRGWPGAWIRSEDYPSRALRNEEQGRVYVTITVGKDGRARDVEVTSSSASAEINEATVRAIMRRARFLPALNKCVVSDGEFETSLNWILPE